MAARLFGLVALAAVMAAAPALAQSLSYAVVDTGQTDCYGDRGRITCPSAGRTFHGQDAQYRGNQPRYRDNGDGTVSDLVTGLMWQKGYDRTSFRDARTAAATARTGGYRDWRVPTIKELYSLVLFSGSTGSARSTSSGPPRDARPYLDTRVFAFEYPATGRYIDAQYVSSTAYVGVTMGRDRSFFGVNFADGRIKAYPQDGGRERRQYYARFVRGNPVYGRNEFRANGDGTVTDLATALIWTKSDSGSTALARPLSRSRYQDGRLDWPEALAFCEALAFGGAEDWRLPNAKELHTLVDYTRAPSVTGEPAIARIFETTPIRDSEGNPDFPWYWTSTTHLDGRVLGRFAVYIAFGTATGHLGGGGSPMGIGGPGGSMGLPPPRLGMVQPGGAMTGPPPFGMNGPGRPPPPPPFGMGPPGGGRPPGAGFGSGPPDGPPPTGGRFGFGGPGPQSSGNLVLMDVHGAGAQRSSPKTGDESRLPKGAGPQGDVQRIYNFARCVRGG